MDNFKAKGLKEAKDKLDILKMSKKDRAIYEIYLEDLHLKASLADTQQYKINKAESQGRKKEKEEIVIKGNEKGLSNDFLSELTGLSIEEVEEMLKKNNNPNF